jgi:hypothetical protein
MKKGKFNPNQIATILKKFDACKKVKELYCEDRMITKKANS